MKIKNLVFIMLMFLSSGCIGTYYSTGEIKSSYPVSIEHMYNVTLYTLKQESVEIYTKRNTSIDADITGYFLDQEPVNIHIDYDENSDARIGVRIGSIADEKRSRKLIRAIRNNL